MSAVRDAAGDAARAAASDAVRPAASDAARPATSDAASDAARVAALFAVDPVGMGGICLRSLVQPARTQWLQLLRDLLPPEAPMRRIPFNIADGRLLGGLDLVATLKANRPIAERGVLATTDGGVVVIAMAERLTAHTAACLNAALDTHEIVLPREGVFIHDQTRVGIVALDEGMTDDEFVPASLRDRLAFLLDLNGFSLRALLISDYDQEDVLEARRLLPGVVMDTEILQALCGTAMTLGAGSTRVSLLAMRAAKAAAALEGRLQVTEADAVLAGRLVLAPRATIAPPARPQSAPADEAAQQEPQTPPAPTDEAPQDSPPEGTAPQDTSAQDSPRDPQPPPDTPPDAPQSAQMDARDIEDVVLAAAAAAIPAGLLARLKSAGREARTGGAQAASMGRVGALRHSGTRGRPSGVRSGAPQGAARLNVIETLRAAAPWQRVRGRMARGDARVRVEPADFRVTRHQQRSQTLTIFAVDASGSSALNRLAEAKGAVELLLADCYIRRDQVAVIAFRGRGADLLLPPTRSLVRAKRSLAGLPGGGGTPLAAAIQAALLLATQAQRRGETPTLVMLTDGRANIGRNGTPGRAQAEADSLLAARSLRLARITSLLVDTSPRPNEKARELAATMNAQYIPLPYASARALSDIVKAASTPVAAR